MEPIPQTAERSASKSRLRQDILLFVSSVGEAYLGQIARALHTSTTRVRWCLHGHLPYYREDIALVPLSLIDRVEAPTGGFYRITTRGRRKARSIVAQRRRGTRRR